MAGAPRPPRRDTDFFIRTSDDGHKRFVQEFLQRIRDNGRDDIYQDVYAGLYCVGCEAFKSEDELVDGKCPEHDVEPEWIEERNWFFRLSAYQEQLLALYDERPDFVLPPSGRTRRGRSSRAGSRTSRSAARAVVGDPDPLGPGSGRLRLGGCARQLPQRADVRATGRGPRDALLAGRPAPAGEGHPALPLRLLARDAARRRLRRPAAALRPRLSAARRPQDLEVARERRRPARAGRRLRRRSGSVLVRPRRSRSDRTGRHRVDGVQERYERELGNDLGNLLSRTTAMVARYRGGDLRDVPSADVRPRGDPRRRSAPTSRRASTSST